jgi:branched-chain amino acid transport system ATP-binding protein
VGGPLLLIEDLAVRYGQVEAVRGISLRVDEGALVSLVGANGAGKTTTLNAIAGLLRPARGHIRFAGQEITGKRSAELVQRGLVLVPEGRQILATLTVRDNLELGGYARSDRAAVTADVRAMMERFPILAERQHLPAGSLSGGEQQMLAIARALVARPRLLLLDEPSMGLAPQVVTQVFNILRDLHAEGRTILLVEQNARKALAISDDAYVLETGQIVLAGRAVDLARDERVTAAYLGGLTSA